jgi:hypothetical protein
MHTTLLALLAPALLLQSAHKPPPQASAPESLTDLAQLPITEATGPRCAIVFALVGQWQKAGEARGTRWPDMETGGGREFFVQAMAGLMDARGLDRTALLNLVARETARLQGEGEERIAEMMPGCMMVKQTAGL